MYVLLMCITYKFRVQSYASGGRGRSAGKRPKGKFAKSYFLTTTIIIFHILDYNIDNVISAQKCFTLSVTRVVFVLRSNVVAFSENGKKGRLSFASRRVFAPDLNNQMIRLSQMSQCIRTQNIDVYAKV